MVRIASDGPTRTTVRDEPPTVDSSTTSPSASPASEATDTPVVEQTPASASATADSRSYGRDASRANESQLRAHLLADSNAEGGTEEPAPSRAGRGRRMFMVGDLPGGAPAASATAAPAEGFETRADGSHVFRGTTGDDRYSVTQSGGALTVTNDDSGATYSLTAAEVRQGVEISTRAGDDTITLDASVRADLDIHGGAGEDFIDGSDARGDLAVHGGLDDDTIFGGSGDDDLDGDGGHDLVLGGDGDDFVHGGSGDDSIFGGAGDDSLWGEAGEDGVFGGAGADIAIGGDGKDTVGGGAGSDVLYGDAEDRITAGTTSSAGGDGSVDQIVAANGATVESLDGSDVVANYDPAEVDRWLDDHPEVRLVGNSEFTDRVRADIGALLSTSQGAGLLNDLGEALQDEGETLRIVETPGSAKYRPSINEAESSTATWDYRDGAIRTPTTALFHELVHGYQDLVGPDPAGETEFDNGRTVENDELQTTGLDWLDASNNPGATGTYNENALRRELGLPERTQYGFETGNPVKHVP